MKYIIHLLLFFPFTIFSQGNMNLALMGTYEWLNTEGSDIWGWVDGAGNEFALVGLKDGFSVVDVTDGVNPVERLYIPDVNSTWRDIKTWGDYAYITTESDTGLLIVDLTDLIAPYTYWHVTSFTNSNGGIVEFTAAHNIFIDENGIAYIFGASSNTGSSPSDGAIFLDVNANPINPVYLGEWDDAYIHDGMVRGDTMYAGCIYAGEVRIVDVSDKTNPQTIGQHPTPSSFTHNAWVSDNGDYIFTTDERSDGYLAAYDIRDLSNIKEVDRIQSNPGSNSIPHNTHVDGNFLITSYYRDGTTVHDITYPNNMVQVAYYDSYSGSGNGFDGCWGTYPFLPSGNIISSDRNSNNGNGVLNIYGRAFQQACHLSGNVTNGNTGFPIANAAIQILSTAYNTTTNLLGDYNTATISSGSYQVAFSAVGYIPLTLNVTLSNGVMTILDAVLYPGSGLLGCTDSNAINYDPNATIDDSSCIYPAGCMNPLAINYNPSSNASTAFGGILSNSVGTGGYYYYNQYLNFDAFVDCKIVSAVVYAQSTQTITFELRDNSASVLDDTTIIVQPGQQRLYFDFDVPSGFNHQLGISGTNSGLYRNNGGVNYPYNIGGLISINSSSASIPSSYYYFYYDIEVEASCILPQGVGCTDSIALNYNPLAIIDDSSCIYCIYGCMDSTQFNYNVLATCDDGSCIPFIYGCIDSLAINYCSGCNVDNGTCVYIIYGCTDPLAINYNPNANIDDSSCIYCSSPSQITGVYIDQIIHDRAVFNWDNMNAICGNVDQIRFRYREVGGSIWSTKTMGAPVGSGCNTSNTSKLVLNLSPSTTYEYAFKIWYCGGVTINWHAQGVFTTAAVCENVTGVTAEPSNSTKTKFCWIAPSSSYAFVRLKYRENIPGSSFSNIGGFGVFAPTSCKNKNGLTPGIQYRVMYRTWCNPNGGPYRSLQWDGPVIWNQPPIRFAADLTIDNLGVYPNPSKGVFNITFNITERQNLEIRIINVVGEEVYQERLQGFKGEYRKQVNTANLPKAIYLLEISLDNGIINKKIILQ